MSRYCLAVTSLPVRPAIASLSLYAVSFAVPCLLRCSTIVLRIVRSAVLWRIGTNANDQPETETVSPVGRRPRTASSCAPPPLHLYCTGTDRLPAKVSPVCAMSCLTVSNGRKCIYERTIIDCVRLSERYQTKPDDKWSVTRLYNLDRSLTSARTYPLARSKTNQLLLLCAQIRNKFGCFDEIREADNKKIRHCNWIRFVTITKLLNENVNLIGRIIRGEVIYECYQPIAPNKEIVVYYDLKNFDTALFQAFYPSLFAASPFFRSHHHAFICRQALQGECTAMVAPASHCLNLVEQIVPSIFPCRC